MTYKYNPKTTKNRFIFYGASIFAAAAGILAFFLLENKLYGIICAILGIWICWIIMKTVKKIQSTRIISYTDGFTVYLSNETKLEFTWESVTHSGIIINGEHKNVVFAYAEKEDKIVKLPPIFIDFESFKEELKEHTPWKEYELEEGQTINDYLKKLLVPEETSEQKTAE